MLPYNLKHTAAVILNVGADSISARHRKLEAIPKR